MKELTCIVCPNSCNLVVKKIENEWVVTGGLCSRGEVFAINEMENPRRSLTTTVKTIYKDMPRLPVKTDGEIPKKDIFILMNTLEKIVVDRLMCCGDIVVKNILGSGVNIVSTSDMNLWLKGE
ncbi:DUF1667 domain-containing protein [uncultured Clostridium sp.]|uniref:DUF1667 domain-containing protein n=1 Tax=uncultured Clostridium sp. TaxID=59620 RepID=UPI0028E3375C|nr:DUF1667 domain-containing protein [uncultured Clostridium sp.]